MQKTFCDGCGKECKNRRVELYGHVRHYTNQGEEVGLDDIPRRDLCDDCLKAAQALLNLVIVPMEFDRTRNDDEVPRPVPSLR